MIKIQQAYVHFVLNQINNQINKTIKKVLWQDSFQAFISCMANSYSKLHVTPVTLHYHVIYRYRCINDDLFTIMLQNIIFLLWLTSLGFELEFLVKMGQIIVFSARAKSLTLCKPRAIDQLACYKLRFHGNLGLLLDELPIHNNSCIKCVSIDSC